MPSLLFYLLFVVRRMIMVYTLVFLPSYGSFQVIIFVLSALFMLVYVATTQPYEAADMNTQEFINEFFVLLTSYFMLVFSDWIPDQ